MLKRLSRVLRWLAIFLGGTVLFQFPITGSTGLGGGCSRFVTNSVANSIDFCYLLDCDNGFFGGLVAASISAILALFAVGLVKRCW